MRRILYRLVAGLVAVAATVEGVHHLIEDSVVPHRMHSLAHAMVSVFLVAALVAQLGRRAVPAGIYLVAAIAIAAGVSDLASGKVGGLEVLAAVTAVLLVVAYPEGRRELVRFRWRLVPLGGALLLALATAPYAIRQADAQLTHASDEFSFYSWMVAMVTLLALALAVVGTGVRGGRLVAWLDAAGLAAVGGLSLALPREPSSFGLIGGAISLVGAVLVGVMAAGWSRTVRAYDAVSA